AVGAVGAGRCR
ncbi:unnamed protein product, partial [Rotaria sp. Silwood1]